MFRRRGRRLLRSWVRCALRRIRGLLKRAGSRGQAQVSGDRSINVQAHELVVSTGLTYADVKDVALDVFRNSMPELAREASEIAYQRAETLVDTFVERLAREAPDSIDEAQNPDFQYALLLAQREYARNGAEDLGDLLVALLVDRAKEASKDLVRIVLNESIATASKLVATQLDVLSLVFILRYTKNHQVNSLESFVTYLRQYVLPVVGDLPSRQSHFQHLEFTGCASIGIGRTWIERMLLERYRGLFQHGKLLEDIGLSGDELAIPLGKVLVSNLHDKEKVQINAIDEESLKRAAKENAIPLDIEEKLLSIFVESSWSPEEVRQYVEKSVPETRDLFEAWEDSPLKNLSLTSVGIAIGQANLRRKIGMPFDLSLWI